MGAHRRALLRRALDRRAAEPGKRGGAFSHGAVPSAHPYILMNYTGKLRDVQTLAHELGHGVHQYLARDQGVFHADTPLTTAETASVFGEMLTFQRVLKSLDTTSRPPRAARREDRRHDGDGLPAGHDEPLRGAHPRRTAANAGELTPDDFADHWMATQTAMYGDSVTLTDDYRRWWSYIPHFVHTPGYVYAYAFGELLVLALYAKYLDEGAGLRRAVPRPPRAPAARTSRTCSSASSASTSATPASGTAGWTPSRRSSTRPRPSPTAWSLWRRQRSEPNSRQRQRP